MWAKRALVAAFVALLPSLASAQISTFTIPPGSLMPPVLVFPASAVNGAGVVTCPQGIATTSTDCLVLLNNTPATAGVPVQMGARVRIGGGAYNSVSTLSEADSMFFEVLPATVAGTTTQTGKLGSIINGGAATYPFQFNSGGMLAFGGLTNGFAGLKATGTTISARLADDSGNASFNAQNYALGAGGGIGVVGNAFIATAPTVTSAGTSPSIASSNGSVTFRVNVGTGGTATTIVMAMPTASTGWNCTGSNLTAAAANRNPTGVLLEQSSTTTAVTMQYQTVATGVALAFVASDVVLINCVAY